MFQVPFWAVIFHLNLIWGFEKLISVSLSQHFYWRTLLVTLGSAQAIVWAPLITNSLCRRVNLKIMIPLELLMALWEAEGAGHCLMVLKPVFWRVLYRACWRCNTTYCRFPTNVWHSGQGPLGLGPSLRSKRVWPCPQWGRTLGNTGGRWRRRTGGQRGWRHLTIRGRRVLDLKFNPFIYYIKLCNYKEVDQTMKTYINKAKVILIHT